LRIAVTGARGILGRLLVAAAPARGWHLDVFAGDVTRPDDLGRWLDSARPAAIVHLAAVSATAAVDADPERARQVNVDGAASVARFAAASGCWLLHASSSHVYRPRPGLIPEDAERSPAGLYGKTKLAAEEAVFSSGARACVARIFSFHHQDQPPAFLVPALRLRLRTEDLSRPFLLRGAANIRDMSRAEDIVDRLARLVARQPLGPVNVGSGRGISVADLARGLAGRELEIVDPDPGPPNSLVADISRLVELTGA